MSSYFDVANRWAERCAGKTTNANLKNQRMWAEEDAIYSYGHHFEMARPLYTTKRSGKKVLRAFLINGARASNTTSGHQSHVRGAIRRTGAPSVIIPYDALEAAGVDLDSIQILEDAPERNETIYHDVTEQPPGSVWHHEKRYGGSRDATPEEFEARVAEALIQKHEDWERNHDKSWYGDKPEPTVENAEKWCSSWDLDRFRRTRDAYYVDVLRPSRGRAWQEIKVSQEADGLTHYTWDTWVHHLGESLIRARVNWSEFHRCQSCHGQGIAEGPLREYSHRAPECPDCEGRGRWSVSHHRWATFLSGWDDHESRPLYFFAEMPHNCKAKTVAEAYESLKPEPVKLAESLGREVHRQGDIFAIPAPTLTKAELKRRGARFEKRTDGRAEWREELGRAITTVEPNRPYILKTNHTASEVAYLPGGLTLVRGTMYHDPQGRERDHARHTVGKTWHVVVKNTVPASR